MTHQYKIMPKQTRPITELDYFKQKLIDRERQLENDVALGDDSARPVELDQTRVGRLSRMDAMQAQAMSMANKQRRVNEMSQIKTALARIEEGSFGDCLECGKPIPKARLEFNPASVFCIHCAEKAR